MVTGLAAMTAAELREADGLIAEVVSDLRLQKGPEEDVERFQRLYEKALRAVLEGRVSAIESLEFERELRAVLAEAERILGPDLAAELEPATRRYLERAFKAGQAVRGVGRAAQTLFDKPRQETVDWLVRHDRFWIGKVFPEQVRDSFRDTIASGIEEGLGRKAIGKRLRDLMVGTAEVPGKAELYNRVAAASVNRANNWGGMFSLEEAGIEEYEFRAVMDQRTSRICRELNGRVFSVPRVMNVVRQALEGPPSAIESIAPWPTFDAGRNDFFIQTGERRAYLGGQSEEWLADHGVALPPLHGNCRSVVVLNR
ncbi:MAG: minor capsid protein [Planctomycetes bacterium]|nr:minor capsid protein [Planctomycetota bacterium]